MGNNTLEYIKMGKSHKIMINIKSIENYMSTLKNNNSESIPINVPTSIINETTEEQETPNIENRAFRKQLLRDAFKK